MDNDRELLEDAARAAGWVSWDWLAGDGVLNVYGADGRHGRFDPLNDDGDALRLAVKLTLEIDVCKTGIAVRTPTGQKVLVQSSEEPDAYAAIRRAITRAAASIGKAMPAPGAEK